MQGGVAITGATGLLGTALAESCARDGIPVSALVRNTARGADLLPSAKLHAWDATRGSPPADAFEGVDVVINLLGENLGEKRWSDARTAIGGQIAHRFRRGESLLPGWLRLPRFAALSIRLLSPPTVV